MSLDARRTIVLDGLPEAAFRAAVGYLDDARRECQLVLVAQGQGQNIDPALGRLAARMVPAIEEIGDAFRAAESTPDGTGALRLVGVLEMDQATLIGELQIQLVHLRAVGRRGDLLLDSTPDTAALLTWIWEEISDQLQGRAPRPYRAST
jgi:hypothetical protein